MNPSDLLARRWRRSLTAFIPAFMLACSAWLAQPAAAESIVHQGPVLDIQVQRGQERLPLFLVPRLQRGDQLLVRPDPESLATGDWILMLGLIAPAGNRVQTQAVDLARLEGYATLEIGADDQAPVIVLAPQLRNLFGLYTSFRDSSTLLDEVIQSDPQRFYDLQRLDEVNQAITALALGLDQVVLNRNPAEGIAAARAMALKFGLSQVNPECFRNNTVNTQCVAVSIVSNKDFMLPSSSELGMLAGGKSVSDLTGFLAEKVKVFSDAGDFLSNKFRDQYDFAATFGRREADGRGTRLFSLTRFRRGNIKTAYVYVPAWFRGKPPTLAASSAQSLCLSAGTLTVQTPDRMPVVNYWHDWQLAFSDAASGTVLGETRQVRFVAERSQFGFEVPASVRAHPQAQVTATLQGRFGFEPAALAPVPLWVPAADLSSALEDTGPLLAGDKVTLRLREPQAACVQAMRLLRGGETLARSSAEQPAQLDADLTHVAPGPLALRVELQGAAPQTLALRVLPQRARVDSLEHTELDNALWLQGSSLARVARVQLGGIGCTPVQLESPSEGPQRLRLECDGDIRHNAALPGQALLHHQGDEPAALRLPLRKLAAAPRVQLASTPGALLVRPSAKAQRWGLAASPALVSDDSGLSLLLRAVDGYVLDKGGYSLQLRFADDPASTRKPLRVPLMSDLAHQELRTRQPVRLQGQELPTVVNPLEYRVLHDSSGLAGAWAPLGLSVLMLPELGALDCAPEAGQWWLHGSLLDLIDAAQWLPADAAPDAWPATDAGVALQPCPDGLCLLLPQTPTPMRLAVRLHWLGQQVFTVNVGRGPSCNAP